MNGLSRRRCANTCGIVTRLRRKLSEWLARWRTHAGFWRIEQDPAPGAPDVWPAIAAIIPARNEEASIGETLRSLWSQDYPGRLRVLVVDDQSEDGTAEEARRAARQAGREEELRVLTSGQLPEGWTGKVWAMHQGLTLGLTPEEPARYVLFSDADIAHGSGALRKLVCRAEAGPCDLVSFMVRLQNRSAAERLMIPAFVFFFRMLYPFRRINDPADPLAGAAGGTMLVRREALERIGGMARIRSALIDDCALAREVKRGGHRIWIGLSETSRSLRSYGRLREVLDMIARTAYTQLGYSPARLVGCVAGLFLIFLAPPLLLLFAAGWAAAVGGLAWLLMSLLYLPMVRFYRQAPFWALLLPLTAALYLRATLLSAWRHHRGRGGQWKGRSGAGGTSQSV
jgi:hopene-associated glycosyltransferase HpnB